MNLYGKGLIPDPPGHAKAPFAALLAARGIDAATETPPNFLDMLGAAPKVFDQGQTGACFPAGTLISMANGTERPIEEIGEGNEVRTHNGKRRRVTQLFRRTYSDNIFTVKVKGNAYRLAMTAEHPVSSVCPDGSIEWVEAKDLKVGQFVLMSAQMQQEERPAKSIRVADFINGAVWEGNGIVRCVEARRPSTIPTHVLVDDRFAQLVGLFLAEGSYRKHDGTPGGLNFTFARHERAYQNLTISLLRELFGVEATLEENEGRPSVSDVRINNSTLAEFFFGLCGESALRKRVPTPFFDAPRSAKIALLRGWLQGDGTQNALPIYKRSLQVSGLTSSIDLHRGLFRIALSCGMRPGAQVRLQEEHQNAPGRVLAFYGLDVFEIFPEARLVAEERGVEPNGKTKNYHRHEMGFACRIESIEVSELEDPIEVFNLEVEGEHTYIANSIAVHNCVGHSIACAIYTRENFRGEPLPFVPSPKGIYQVARALGRISPTQKLTDDGSMPSLAVQGVGSYGIRELVSLEGRYSDCEPSTINDEPAWGELEKDALITMLGTYAIANTTARIDAIRLALSKGFPIACSVDASDGGPLQMYTGGVIESLGTTLDHYTCIVGYETIDGETVLTLRNSWNRAFGEDGNFRIGPKAIAQLGDLYVFDVLKVVNP